MAAVDFSEKDFRERWLGLVRASLKLIDGSRPAGGELERWLRWSGAYHRYIPLLMTGRGIGWITRFTIPWG